MTKNVVKYAKQSIVPISIIAICIYALYERIMVLYHHELWEDELFQLSFMKGTFFDLLICLPEAQPGSYLAGDFYLVYPFFKIFSYNKWGLAIPHIISTILGFYFLYLICKRYLRTIWGYLIVFLIVCFNATLINHATEIRVYAVLPTLALASFYVLQRMADLNFKLNIRKMIGTSVFFVLAIWFHIFGILIFFSCFLFFLLAGLIECQKNNFKAYFKNALFFMSVILCLTLPFWLYNASKSGHFDLAHDPFAQIPNPISDTLGFLKSVFCNLIGFKKLYFLILGAVVPFVLPCKDRYKQLLFLVCTVFLPLAAILVSAVCNSCWFLQRYFIWAIPFFAFYLGWAWDSFFVLLKTNRIKRAK